MQQDPRRELEALRAEVLDEWAISVDALTFRQREMAKTLSWRVTRPLRAFEQLRPGTVPIGVIPYERLRAVRLAQDIDPTG